MARLQLTTSIYRTVGYRQQLDRTGLPARIPLYRIHIPIAVTPPQVEWEGRPHSNISLSRSVFAVVDTGSPLCVFHHDAWKPFKQEIRWLAPVHTNPNSRQTLTVLGGTWPYRLGRIRIAAFDDGGGWFPPSWTLGLFLEDSPGCPSVNIIGLRSPFLQHRQLRHSGNDARQIPVWHLEDA